MAMNKLLMMVMVSILCTACANKIEVVQDESFGPAQDGANHPLVAKKERVIYKPLSQKPAIVEPVSIEEVDRELSEIDLILDNADAVIKSLDELMGKTRL